MSTPAFILALIVSCLATLGILTHLEHKQTRYLYTLANYAPETLVPPTLEQFNTYENYTHALVRYAKHNHWAIEE